jgi:pimeloyl-ACP methyl ester carboxylesterase
MPLKEHVGLAVRTRAHAMLARFLIAFTSAELALYLLAGLSLARHFALPAVYSLPFALTAALAARAALIALSFALSVYYGTAPPAGARLGIAAKLRLFGGEWLAFVALFTLLQPLERLITRQPLGRTEGAESLPVLLIPGLYCNGAVWWWMRRRLRGNGCSLIWTLTLEPPLASIDDLARQLSREIARICEATGARRVVLVSHSLGGLVARASLRDPGTRSRVAKLVALACPHHGSQLARWGLGSNARQLRPDNPWLAALNTGELGPAPVPIVSLFSWHDNFVAPQDSQILAHATNVPMSGIGHLSLLFSQRVARRVCLEVAGAAQT